MGHVLSAALGAPVSIAATTSDQMGFTGRGEGIYVIANALVIPSHPERGEYTAS